jgi:hypothetical protein
MVKNSGIIFIPLLTQKIRGIHNQPLCEERVIVRADGNILEVGLKIVQYVDKVLRMCGELLNYGLANQLDVLQVCMWDPYRQSQCSIQNLE